MKIRIESEPVYVYVIHKKETWLFDSMFYLLSQGSVTRRGRGCLDGMKKKKKKIRKEYKLKWERCDEMRKEKGKLVYV